MSRWLKADEAAAILHPHFPTFWDGWTQALEYAELVAGVSSCPVDPSMKAMLMNRAMVDYVRRELSGKPGVSVIDYNSVVLTDFEGKALVRWKKLSDRRLARNIDTRQQRLFGQQDIQSLLPGFGNGATVLVVGYQLDALGGKIKDVLVTCPFEGENLWHFSIPKPIVLAEMVVSGTPVVQGPAVRVKAKLRKDRGSKAAE